MSDFEDKLNAILSNRDAMGQIMALAQSLGGQEEVQPKNGEEEEPVRQPEQAVPTADSMQDLGAMLGQVDPQMMRTGIRLLQEYNRADDRNVALLRALRPFVREERFAKVDRAIQIARLSRVIRVLFDSFKEKGGGTGV